MFDFDDDADGSGGFWNQDDVAPSRSGSDFIFHDVFVKQDSEHARYRVMVVAFVLEVVIRKGGQKVLLENGLNVLAPSFALLIGLLMIKTNEKPMKNQN